jgi:hypothetical protein
MAREVNVTKLLHAAHEAKIINLEIPLKAVVSEAFIGAAAISDEPWDLICADWISLIRRGPRGGLREVETIAGSLRNALFEVKGLTNELRQTVQAQ